MSDLTFDAVVVGAGYIGCAVAYHLTQAGLRVALLERGSVAAGASRANYGNIQVQDAELGVSLPLVTAGWQRWRTVEEELDCPVGRRPLGSLLLIETEAQWRTLADRLPTLHAAGISAELVPADRLPELEPLLNPAPLLGACYHPHEGQVNPFQLMWAYLRRAQAGGLALHTHTELLALTTRAGQVRGLRTSRGDFSAPAVILCTGAWTERLGRHLGRSWRIPFVHGQALVTEPTSLRLRNHLASAAFFEAAHDDSGQSVALAISQTASGHFLLGEAAAPATDTGSAATGPGQAAIAALTTRYLPRLQSLRVLRGWGAPVAFTADGRPFLGPVAGIDGLILATAFKSTVIVTPVVGRTVAQLVTGGQTDLDLTPFAPDRKLSDVH